MDVFKLSAVTCLGIVATVAACSSAPAPVQTPPASTNETNAGEAEDTGETVDVVLCDNETTVTVPKDAEKSVENGQAIASSLMEQWLNKHPDKHWEMKVRTRHGLEPAANNFGVVGTSQGHAYGDISKQDVLMWKDETERMALAGSRVFHSGDELGSTVGVSCDMCHPNAANTHPETYPKFQRQLGRAVLLRDAINWCIEHPVRGEPLDADDPRMRAMEAYIYAQRRGKTLEYGKL